MIERQVPVSNKITRTYSGGALVIEVPAGCTRSVCCMAVADLLAEELKQAGHDALHDEAGGVSELIG